MLRRTFPALPAESLPSGSTSSARTCGPRRREPTRCWCWSGPGLDLLGSHAAALLAFAVGTGHVSTAEFSHAVHVHDPDRLSHV